MSVFCCSPAFAPLAKLCVLSFGGDGEGGRAPDSDFERPEDTPQRDRSLLLALILATSLHILLFLALTAQPGMKRGAEAASFQVELRPALQAQIVTERPAALARPAPPETVTMDASDAELSIEQKAPAQQERVEQEQPLPEKPQQEEERQELREQKQGCIGPEEMARLEQERRSGSEQPGDGRAAGLGIPCVEG